MQHLAEAFLELVGPDRVRHREFRAAPPGSPDHDGNHHQQDEDEGAEADQRIDDAHRPVAQHENDLVHGALLADSRTQANEEGTWAVNSPLIFMVNET